MECIICSSPIEIEETLYKCTNCGHIYKSIPDNIKKQKTYHQDLKGKMKAIVDEQGMLDPTFHEMRERIVDARFKKIRKYLQSDYIVLDIGGSAGTMALKMKDVVQSIDIVDLAPYQKAESERLGFQFYQEDFVQWSNDKIYNVSMMWHVLEHISDVHSCLQKVKDITTHYAFIEVPYKRPVYKTSRDNHVQYFTERSFRLLLEKYFSVVSIQEGVQEPALLAISGV